jgi:hypothetical protein
MAGKPAGQEEDGVDTNVVAGPGKAGRQPLGGDGNAAQPKLVERHRRALLGGARLNLDEGDNPSAARDQIDFAAGDARSYRQDPPAMQPQPPGSEALAAPAAPFCKLAAVQRLSSSARA